MGVHRAQPGRCAADRGGGTAREAELFDRAINTADKTVAMHNFRLRYLAPFNEVFRVHARAHDIEEAWLLGLTRQESRFIVNAKSVAGAQGLMQLMPATARWVAGKIGMADFRPARVIEPETNITLGARYLKLVLSDLGHPLLASAAYNAGPGRARRWRGVTPLEGAIYAETIPFNETRDYVKKVMANTVYYSALLGGTHQSLKARLGIIPAKAAGERFNEEPHDRQHPGTRRRRLHRPPCRQRVAARGGVTARATASATSISCCSP